MFWIFGFVIVCAARAALVKCTARRAPRSSLVKRDLRGARRAGQTEAAKWETPCGIEAEEGEL